MVGIESEVIQGSPTNGIGILVLGKGLRAPVHLISGLIRAPGNVTKPGVSQGSIVWKPRMIQRSMKSQIAYRDSAPQGHTEGLNRTIEVLIINRVLIMVHSPDWAGYFVGNEGAPIDSRHRFNWTYGSTGPSVYRKRRSHSGTYRRKSEACRTVNMVLTVRRIVVHVALTSVSLTPGILIWSHIE